MRRPEGRACLASSPPGCVSLGECGASQPSKKKKGGTEEGSRRFRPPGSR